MLQWRSKTWRICPRDESSVTALREELKCSELAAILLVNRGISTPEAAAAFKNPSYNQLADPFLLPDAYAAVERIRIALKKGEKIRVHGDYDTDGVTSAALWKRLLEKLGADVDVFVPHRKLDGYDIRSKFINAAGNDGVKLIITTDCGTQRVSEIEEAREAGIDVIVTDHHEPGPCLPKAVAVVNPKRADSKYAFHELAGVGVAFRLGEALVRHLGKSVDSFRKAYSDLAAIGTITDVMHIIDENRVLVKYGLEQLQNTRKPGLRALLEVAGIRTRQLTSYNIAYNIGPRLNAAGRVDDSRISLDLLLTRDAEEAAILANKLENANNDRRREEMRILEEALQQAIKLDMDEMYCLVLSDTTWHSGVVGLVANKVVERFHRPVIMIAFDDEKKVGRGSARTIRAFNINEALTACGEYLIEYGGHDYAAGLSIERANLEAFTSAINDLARSKLVPDDLVPVIDVDAEVDPADITRAFMDELQDFQPWGRGNAEPIFVSRSVKILDIHRIGKELNHIKMLVCSDSSDALDALMWRVGDMADHLHSGDYVDICYRPELNHYNGKVTVQLKLEDIRPAE